MDQTIDLLDIAAKRYPIKKLADELEKAESTLRNELTQQPGYKLGLLTSVRIMKKTGDLSALDRIEKVFFNRIAYEVPEITPGDMEPLINLAAKLTKEYGEQMTAIGAAMLDGRISKEEAEACLDETEDLIRPILQIRTMFQSIIKRKAKFHKP